MIGLVRAAEDNLTQARLNLAQAEDNLAQALRFRPESRWARQRNVEAVAQLRRYIRHLKERLR